MDQAGFQSIEVMQDMSGPQGYRVTWPAAKGAWMTLRPSGERTAVEADDAPFPTPRRSPSS